MEVGIVGGTGPAGRALAARLAASGRTVVLGSRDAQRASGVAREIVERWPTHKLAITGDANESAAKANIVVLATAFEATVPTARALESELDGRVVVSMANGLTRVGHDFEPILSARGSIAATVQAVVPRSRIAAAFHHLPAGRFAEIDRPLEAEVLVCADDEEAADVTIGLVDSIPGLKGLRCGSLAAATAVEALTAVLVNVNVRYKVHTTLRLTGFSSSEIGRSE